MLRKERGAARSEVLGIWRGGASSVDMPKEGGAPSQGRSAAREERSVCGMQEGEPCRKKLQQLLEVEGTGVKEGDEEAEREEGTGIERKDERAKRMKEEE